jgi:type VI secretion system Hcp family effector
MAEIVLDIEGIPGECTTKKYEGKITVNSISLNATQEVDRSTNTPRTKHTISVEDVSVSRNFDKSSLVLMDYLVTGKTIPKATFWVLRAIGDQVEAQDWFLKITLTDALISSQNFSINEGDLTDDLTFDFNKIEFAYRPGKPDGTVDTGEIPTNFNALLGKKE